MDYDYLQEQVVDLFPSLDGYAFDVWFLQHDPDVTEPNFRCAVLVRHLDGQFECRRSVAGVEQYLVCDEARARRILRESRSFEYGDTVIERALSPKPIVH